MVIKNKKRLRVCRVCNRRKWSGQFPFRKGEGDFAYVCKDCIAGLAQDQADIVGFDNRADRDSYVSALKNGGMQK